MAETREMSASDQSGDFVSGRRRQPCRTAQIRQADATVTPSTQIVTGRPQSAAIESLAVRRRRQCRKEEWNQQIRLASLFVKYLDHERCFFSSLENKPLSMISGIFGRRKGIKPGLPDVLILFRSDTGTIVVFIELKSRAGRLSKIQKRVRAELLRTGARWWMVRTARAGLLALRQSGAVFKREWRVPRIEAWEGPFESTERLPVHPQVMARRREEKRRYRLRRAMRAREAAKLTAERDDTAGDDIAA